LLDATARAPLGPGRVRHHFAQSSFAEPPKPELNPPLRVSKCFRPVDQRLMSVDKYRRHAVECLRIAEGLPDTVNRMQLIDMAQSWLLLAQQAEKTLIPPPAGYETAPPPETSRTAVTQQQQQIQPKKD